MSGLTSTGTSNGFELRITLYAPPPIGRITWKWNWTSGLGAPRLESAVPFSLSATISPGAGIAAPWGRPGMVTFQNAESAPCASIRFALPARSLPTLMMSARPADGRASASAATALAVASVLSRGRPPNSPLSAAPRGGDASLMLGLGRYSNPELDLTPK